MDEPFDITFQLDEEEAAKAIAEYVARKMGSEFTVKSEDVGFEYTKMYEDRPWRSSKIVFNRVTVSAKKRSGGETNRLTSLF